MDINKIKIKKRNIKYARLELKTGSPVLVIPENKDINYKIIFNKHKNWFNKKIDFINKIKEKYNKEKLIFRSNEELVKLVNKYILFFSSFLKISPKKIYFRLLKTKWGSCSKSGRIYLNFLLKYLPEDLVKYVVYHELVHLIIPSHKKDFWLIIKKQFKDYYKYEEKLYGYWFLLYKENLLL